MDFQGTFDADILIAGGSTAGLATAIYGAMAGLRCLIIEPNVGIVDKPCGEGLLPSAVSLLNEMGIDTSNSYPIVGIRYITCGKKAEGRFSGKCGLGMRRTELQSAMHRRALQLGVRFIKGKITKYIDHGSHVVVGKYTGRWLVGCDGLRSAVRLQMNGPKTRQLPARFGLRQHFIVEKSPDFVEVYWASDFEIYVTPVSPTVVNVAVLFSKSRPFATFLASVPDLNSTLLKPVSKLKGAGPFKNRPGCLHSGNVFLVGDAAGFLDPLTGEGNQLAIAAARELITCISEQRIDEYTFRWQKMIRGYWLLTTALLKFTSYRLGRNLIVPLLRSVPGLFAAGFYCLSYQQSSMKRPVKNR